MKVHINGGVIPGPLYLDASALAKAYIPEAASDLLNAFLSTRRDLVTSRLAITEVTSSLCRRRAERSADAEEVNGVYRRLRRHVEQGDLFQLADLTDEVHRQAEHELLASNQTPLRAGDALHLALAIATECRCMVTFDHRLAEASRRHGLAVFPEKHPE
jgi:predicted nucleic acid-binding protein